MIATIVDGLTKQDAQFRNKWLQFRTIYGRDIGGWNERAAPETYHNGRRGFSTAMGDVVKSKEERLIANWLFYHGIRYQYERDYELDTASERHRQYRPDFYYPDVKLYHEHFALNGRGILVCLGKTGPILKRARWAYEVLGIGGPGPALASGFAAPDRGPRNPCLGKIF
jgi:hypothetical protein